MNIFVLCTGRCGSTTFARACAHMTNYTVGHETRSGLIRDDRLAYPPEHIEVDNRLAWFLGRLDRAYGDTAHYVHLTRNREATGQSFRRRYDSGILYGYRSSVLMGLADTATPDVVCADYVDTVTENIHLFLLGRSRVSKVEVETARVGFEGFWQAIGARGSLAAALAEWDRCYNASTGAPGASP